MPTKLKIGAVLIAALALCLPAALFFPNQFIPALFVLSGLGGTVVVTYATFLKGDGPHEGYAGGLVAPTTTQSQTVNAVCAQVFMDDTDTTADITHDFQLTVAEIAALQPFIDWYVDTFKDAATAIYPTVSFPKSLHTSNTVTIRKQSANSSGGTYNVIIRRPWSASQ